MSDITVSEDRLREAIAAAINDVRGAGVTFQQYAVPIADGVIDELTKPSEQELLKMARVVVGDCTPGSYVATVAKAYIAKCSEIAKPDPELDKGLDQEWVESILGACTVSNKSPVDRSSDWWAWDLKCKNRHHHSGGIRLYREGRALWVIDIDATKTINIKSRRQFLALCEGLGVELLTKKGGAE